MRFDYTKIPYKWKGRDRAGLDCWGVVYLFHLENHGIELPKYTGDYADELEIREIERLINEKKTCWVEVPAGSERPGDVISLRVSKRVGGECVSAEAHVGIVAPLGRFLSARHDDKVVLEDYRGIKWNKRVEGFYRHESLA